MKLQSQETKKFDPRVLRRLAKRTKPWSWKDLIPWTLAGLAVGGAMVIAFRYHAVIARFIGTISG